MSKESLLTLPLRGLLKDPEIDRTNLAQTLASFSCERRGTQYDCYVQNVEDFLRRKAITYECKGFSRTYLIVTNAELDSSSLNLLGYFTLGLTVTSYEGIPTSMKRKVLRSFPGRDSTDYFPGLLIGQLGRDQNCSRDTLTTRNIFELIDTALKMGQDAVGGSLLYLDCAKEMLDYYQARGFAPLDNRLCRNDLFRLFRPMPEVA